MILYRYSIDTVSISYRYSIDIACKNPKTGCLWGRKTERQVLLGSENRSTGALSGRLGVALGGQRGGQGGSGGGRGRPPAAEKNFFISGGLKLWNFVRTLISFGNGWKLIKMNFSSNFFLKVDLIGCFRELNVRKFLEFFSETKKQIFRIFLDFLRKRIRKSGNLEWDDLVILFQPDGDLGQPPRRCGSRSVEALC